ncbi:MAG: SBBP repeat-containing protein [Bacteroidia bacterium]
MKKTILLANFIFLFSLVFAQTPGFKWAASVETDGFSAGHSIAVDASGNVYTTGSFSGSTTDFDPGPGVTVLSSLSKERDIFISKFDANGKFLWAKQVGSYYEHDISLGIALDALNNVYVTGYFYGTVDFDPGPGVYNLQAVGLEYMDNFILKLTSNGNFAWAKRIGGKFEDISKSITVDPKGNVYTTGYFFDTVDFNPGAGVYKLVSQKLKNGSEYTDGFILKLNTAGDFVWAKRIGGDNVDYCHSITSDKFGNVYTAGSFTNTVDFDPGPGIVELMGGNPEDAFILKLDSSGYFVWAKSFAGINHQIGYSIALDAMGNVYTIGMFESKTDFDPGAGTFELSASGSRTVFISKLNSSGNFVWAKDLGEMDFSLITHVNEDPLHLWGFTVDKAGNIYRTGALEDLLDFDPGSATFNLSSKGGYDIFISKLDSAGKFKWAHRIGEKSDDVGNAIAVDNKGNIFTTGWFQDSVDFDLGSGKFNLTSYGNHALFINKMGEGTGSTKEFIKKSNFKIYPNPSSGILNIDLENLNNSNIKIQIINSIGQIMLEQTTKSQHSQFDIKDLSNGLFLVKVMDGNSILTFQRIIKQ